MTLAIVSSGRPTVPDARRTRAWRPSRRSAGDREDELNGMCRPAGGARWCEGSVRFTSRWRSTDAHEYCAMAALKASNHEIGSAHALKPQLLPRQARDDQRQKPTPAAGGEPLACPTGVRAPRTWSRTQETHDRTFPADPLFQARMRAAPGTRRRPTGRRVARRGMRRRPPRDTSVRLVTNGSPGARRCV
jgi:hypothetical protein